MSLTGRHPPDAPVITAVTMGYGHLRAAAAVADQLGLVVEPADASALAGPVERLIWSLARHGYHALSRRSGNDRGNPTFGGLLDRLTTISNRGSPSGAVTTLDALSRLGFGTGLGRRLERAQTPLVATFYGNAIAAERHSTTPIACIVTDSVVHRVWAPTNPPASRIRYLVPAATTVECLRRYGVRPEAIRLTGFPLPPELVGADDDSVLEANMAARLHRLGAAHADQSGPVHLVVAVGGAGAQVDHAGALVDELYGALAGGRIRLTLVAGTHGWVARRFERRRAAALATGLPPSSVEVLHEPSFDPYYRRFNRLLSTADILWTKPSELVFYAALGLPLILDQPIGDHERCNRALVVDAGAAMDRSASGSMATIIAHRLASGWFAEAAARGRARLPADGARAIARFCSRELYDEFTRG